MYFNLNTTFKRCSVVAFLPFIAACGNMAPGMRLDAKYVPDSTAQPQPAPVIKLITPSLLQAEKAAKAQQANQNINALLGDPKPYVIGNGDMLSILVWDHPELNIAAAGAQALTSSGAQTPAVFVVDQDGMVQFPYVGVIKLAGLTELDARNTLADKMVKSIKRPDITLRVQSFRSKKIYVDGEVKTPGNQAIDDVPMTLFEGLTRAGGFLPTADQSYVVITRSGVSYPVNLPMLVKQGIDTARIMLAHGDVVRVRSRDENKVYVLGEVNTPRALPMNNGRMTLTEALGEAGGLSQLSSAAGQVYVVRNAGESEPIVYNLDAESPVALALAENFELNPRDVVFVDASGLARFNRVISLIIPSAATVATGAVAATTVSAAKK
jgi:polysaccharide export outer membrane protein